MECNCNECNDKGYSKELLEQAKLLWEIHKDEFKPVRGSISLLQWVIKNWDTYGERIYACWDWDKNSDEGNEIWLISRGARIVQVWFICDSGHSWNYKPCEITSKSKKAWCPYCNHQRIMTGESDLLTWCEKPENKEIGDYIRNCWMIEKNLELGYKIDTIATKTGKKKVWMKCERGHEWMTTPYRLTYGHHCPYCANVLLLKGYNDFETYCKNNMGDIGIKILEGWSEKNNFKPDEVMYGSNKKVIFKCDVGHEFESVCCYVTLRGSWCPICSGYKNKKTSLPEKTIYWWCKEQFNEVYSRYKINGKEADIFIKDIGLVIEYQGEAWHKGDKLEKDFDKYQFFKNLGYDVLWIVNNMHFESKYGEIPMILHEYEVNDRCENVIKGLSKYFFDKYGLNVKPKLNDNILFNAWNDLYSDGKDVLINWCNSHKDLPQSKEILESWNYELNSKNGITPNNIKFNSATKVYFTCNKCNQVYEGPIYRFTKIGGKCPYCQGRRILSGFNDFETWAKENNRLDILEEWNYEKNGELLPSMITPGSNKQIHWKCQNPNCRNEWCARPSSRKIGFANCPKCGRKKPGKKKSI